jgi:hypothetical protein
MRRRELTPEYSPAGTMRRGMPCDRGSDAGCHATAGCRGFCLVRASAGRRRSVLFCDRMDSVCSVGGARSICFIGTLGSTALGVAELLASTLAASVPDENNFG